MAVLVSIHGDPRLMTANLLAPLLINYKKMLGMQTVMNNSNYTTRCNILDEMQKNRDMIVESEKKNVEKQKKEQEAAIVNRKATAM